MSLQFVLAMNEGGVSIISWQSRSDLAHDMHLLADNFMAPQFFQTPWI
ncbi:MAG: hypothetical protein KJ958_07030 [Gammaproteobacteria bacterium]|nr:hypothetical protein [Gammaproteobacteria bacterium]MBU1978904.1 hypothetical protein [Gammaproteobacteria bacterium]